MLSKSGLEKKKDSENIYGHIQERHSACLLWVVYFYFYLQDKYFKNSSCLLILSFRAVEMLLPTLCGGISEELGLMFVIKLTYNHSIDLSLLIMAVKHRLLQRRGKHYMIPNFENYN